MRIRAILPLATSLLVAAPVLPAVAQTMREPTPPLVQAAHQRLVRLHAMLQITPQQEPAFDRFAQVAMRDAFATQHMFGQLAGNIPHVNAEQDLSHFADVQLQVVGEFQRIVPAFDQLYSELSPEQRQTADYAFRRVAERHEQAWNNRLAEQYQHSWNNQGPG